MAITGKLVFASIQFEPQILDMKPLKATVILEDDALGVLGQRVVPVDDPTIVAQVRSFVEQMLPSLSAQVGVPITLPDVPVAPALPNE